MNALIFPLVMFATSLIASVSASKEVAQCGPFYFNHVSGATIHSRALLSVARIFEGKSGPDYRGTAIVIDKGRRLLATAAHVTDGATDLYVDFPARQDYKRYPAMRIERLTWAELDVTIIQLDAPIPNNIPALELQARNIESGKEHFFFSYPKATEVPLYGNVRPSSTGNQTPCRFQFRAITTTGDSGGAVIEPGLQLSGIVIQSDNFESQGKFVRTKCFYDALVSDGADVGLGVDETIVGRAAAIADTLTSEVPRAAQLALKPYGGEEWISNMDLSTLVDGIISDPQRFCSLKSYMYCPILQAVSDRLDLENVERAFRAKEILDKTICLPPAAELNKATSDIYIPEPDAKNFVHKMQAVGETIDPVRRLPQADANSAQSSSSAGKKFKKLDADGGAVDPEYAKRLATFLAEQAMRHKANNRGADYKFFTDAALKHYEIYLDDRIEQWRKEYEETLTVSDTLREETTDALNKVANITKTLKRYAGEKGEINLEVASVEVNHNAKLYLELLSQGAEKETTTAEMAVRNWQKEKAAWDAATRIDSLGAYSAYLRSYPVGVFAEIARTKIPSVPLAPENEYLEISATERQLPGTKVTENELGWGRSKQREIQARLNLAGFDSGYPDGLIGPKSRKAIGQWQTANDFVPTGYFTDPQLRFLIAQTEVQYVVWLKQQQHQISRERGIRASAKIKGGRKDTSSIVRDALIGGIVGGSVSGAISK